jgi:hypothetical protein
MRLAVSQATSKVLASSVATRAQGDTNSFGIVEAEQQPVTIETIRRK